VLSLDGGRILKVKYHDTDQFRLTRDFLSDPEEYFHHLFEEE
jgi:predicted ATPase